MQNAVTAAIFQAGQELLQSFNGETVQIGNETFTCLPADLIQGTRSWEQGGTLQIISATLSILKTDMPAEPVTDTLAVFRGNNLRVISAGDADTFWQIQLVQQNA
jgi:hypothetical protein